MSLAFFIVYCFIAFNLLLAANKHGQPREDDWNFWITALSQIISIVLIAWCAGWRFF